MSARRSLLVSYGQIAVFQESQPQPFNGWTEAHVNQGFAWRPGAVSFRTKEEGGLHDIEIVRLPQIGAPFDGLRVIEVPFTVSSSDPVVIASIDDEFQIEIPEGSYALRFAIAEEDSRRIALIFSRNDQPEFRILRADLDLLPGDRLLTSAEPA